MITSNVEPLELKKMKFLKYITLVIAFTALCIGMGSCNKVSHNGKIDGFWQIMTIEDVATGEIASPQSREYIAINLHVIQLTGATRITGNMSYDKKAGTLACDFQDFSGLKVEAQAGALAKYGIMVNPVTMNVVKVDGKSLVLRTDQTLITCRRF